MNTTTTVVLALYVYTSGKKLNPPLELHTPHYVGIVNVKPDYAKPLRLAIRRCRRVG